MSRSYVMAKPRVNRGFLWRVSLIAGLGGILYGFDVGIIAAALVFVRSTFALSTQMQELVVSVVPIGTMAGAILGGIVSDRLGRRSTLLWSGAIFIFGSILAPVSPNVATLIVARLLLGVAIGFTSVTAPVYVSELAPPQSRGTLIGFYQFALTLGIVLANVVGYWLAGQHAWRLMFGLGALPAVVFFFLVLTVPESPRWLYAQGRVKEAERVLLSYADEAGAKELLADIEVASRTKVDRRWSVLWTPAVRRGLLIAVGFVVLQQFTGINAVIYYGPQIFALAGITSNENAIFAALLVSVMNMLATIIALFLVDRLGRKPLLYAGLSGMMASLFVLAYSFQHAAALGHSMGVVATVCLVVYITCCAASMGPIAWILVSEVFPLRVRGRGAAAATLGYGISNTVVSLTFLSVLQRVGTAMTFAMFGVCCLVTLAFVRWVVPETKGMELESISAAPAEMLS